MKERQATQRTPSASEPPRIQLPAFRLIHKPPQRTLYCLRTSDPSAILPSDSFHALTPPQIETHELLGILRLFAIVPRYRSLLSLIAIVHPHRLLVRSVVPVMIHISIGKWSPTVVACCVRLSYLPVIVACSLSPVGRRTLEVMRRWMCGGGYRWWEFFGGIIASAGSEAGAWDVGRLWKLFVFP